MNEQNKKLQLLGSVPVSKALLSLGLPTMVGMLINALYNLVDTYFVGGLGTNQMGAITVAFPLGQVIVGLGLLFGNGAAAYLSRSVPIPKALLSLGLPTMVGMLINALYNLVDTYFVGGLGTNQMGAITVAFPLGQIIVGLGLLFGNGAAAYLSRLIGKQDKETAGKVASTALYSSVGIGFIAIIISLIFMKPILTCLGATDSVMTYALSYSYIYITFSIFNIFNVTMSNIVSSEGAAKTAMYALLCGAALNVVLDPVMIYVLHLGVTGAAIATAISQI